MTGAHRVTELMAGCYILLPVYSSPPSLPAGQEVSLGLGHLDRGNLGMFVLFLQNIGSLRHFYIVCSELGSAALSLLFPGHSKTTLHCQVVLTQSVLSQCFPQFGVRHCGQEG